MLLDFNFAAHINHPSTEDGEGEWHDENRNDVKGVIFTIDEIITRDESLRDAPREEQNIDSLPLEWLKHQEVQLDRPVVEYRQVLQERRDRRALYPGSGDAPKAINWPPRLKPPKVSVPMADVHGTPLSVTMDQWYERKQAILERGGKMVHGCVPAGIDAVNELYARLLAQYLLKHYLTMLKLSVDSSELENLVIGDTHSTIPPANHVSVVNRD
ncbi:EKC/KEOPS complex subunit BUD32 [Fusarium falciforme]|uniref:EKC/KEOPS complex subunit BUD32 n=1 Tax=Fusarium falciforme TaxID=195108 RepID=UPI002300C320|nr:EKC/KEOPS complex subunit BUD32 [Fusarium falciforme]WAO88813.1 EKC/KEOPS complex subunit BUD32 [Fusarium falciforme]